MRVPGSHRSDPGPRRGSRPTRCRIRPLPRRCCAPRACACDSSSSTTTAAPSAITNPSRPASNGTRRSRRIAVSHRQRAHRPEAREPDRCDRRLGAAAEHHVGSVEPDRIQAVAERHVRGCACGALRHERATRAELDRDPPGSEVRQGLDDRERAYPLRAATFDLKNALLERAHAADRSRDRRAGSLGHTPNRETGVRLGLAGGRQHELRAPIHPPCRLPVDERVDIQILHFTGEPCRVAARIEPGDRACPRSSCEQRGP